MRRSSLLALALGCLVIAGCGDHGHDGASSEAVRSLDAYTILPGSTTSDLVTYGDALLQISVLSETLIGEPPADGELDYVGREVALDVLEVVWSSDRVEVPPKISMTTAGWIATDGDLSPVTFNHGARLEVGQSYLVQLVNYSEGWGLQNNSTVWPQVEDPKVTRFEILRDERESDAPIYFVSNAFATTGSDMASIRQAVELASVAPEALRWMDLDPANRRSAVVAEATGEIPGSTVEHFLEVAKEQGVSPEELLIEYGITLSDEELSKLTDLSE